MNYVLKLYDIDLLKFQVKENIKDPVIEIVWVNNQKELLPLGLECTNKGLSKWLKGRTIPKNRAYVDSFLSKCGLSSNRPMDVIGVCKGLSLNDAYWVVEDNFDGKFIDYNLYTNRFSRILSLIAFTGYGSSARSIFDSSPEFTTNGMLPKCWRRIKGKIYLYKGGTKGFLNSGNEPYSEYYASKIAKQMGIHAIYYNLSKWKGELCSTCELFTNIDISYVPIGTLIKSGGFEKVKEYYYSLGKEYIEAFEDMIVFDAVICNTDRHFGNFGVLVDSKTNTIISPAPLFDHGNSLFTLAFGDDLISIDTLQRYADTQYPAVYNDYFIEAKKVIKPRHKEMLRKLLQYRIERHPRYNLDKKRLELIENVIHERAKRLLDD